ncbi:hypothetical protein OG216_47355 (plasmid) [Streptomycetaceae bacterium NBC_01309]
MTDTAVGCRAAQELLDALDPFLTARLCEAYDADPGLEYQPVARALQGLQTAVLRSLATCRHRLAVQAAADEVLDLLGAVAQSWSDHRDFPRARVAAYTAARTAVAARTA